MVWIRFITQKLISGEDLHAAREIANRALQTISFRLEYRGIGGAGVGVVNDGIGGASVGGVNNGILDDQIHRQ